MAVLLTAPGKAARVVVVDAGRGLRLSSFGLSRAASYLEIVVVPGPAGSSSTLAILAQSADGTVRALRRDAATGARLGQVSFGRAFTPAALVVLPWTLRNWMVFHAPLESVPPCDCAWW